MRLSFWLAGLVGILLLLAGFRVNALPFIPNAAFSDAAVSHYPAAVHLNQSITVRGEFPLWQELNMAGQPFAANPLNKTAYPLQWLAIVLPAALHLNVMILLHLAIAAWGMSRWARALGLRAEAAAIGALAYVLAPRTLGHIGAGHLDLLYALAWFPWLMHATWELCQTQFSLSSALRLSLFASLVLLADVRLSLFAFISAAAYGIADCSGRRRWQPILTGAAAFVPFAVMTAALTIPLALWSPFLTRSVLTVQETGAFSLSPTNLVGILLPLPAGDVEMLTYVGSAPLVLAFIAIFRDLHKYRFWLSLLLLAVLYALGTNSILWQALTTLIPVLRWFRVPARAWFIVALVLPLLAAYGTQTLFDLAEKVKTLSRRQLSRAKLLVAVYIVVITLVGGYALFSASATSLGGLILLFSGIAISIVVWWVLSQRVRSHILTITLLLIVAIDLGANGLRWLEWRGREDWFAPHAALAAFLQAEDADRIYSPAYSLPQQVAIEYNLHLFGGVDPFQLSRSANAIERASGVGNRGYSVVQPPQPVELSGDSESLVDMNRSATPDVQLLANWQVSHIIAPYPINDAQLRELSVINGIYVYRNLAYEQTLPLNSIPRWLPSSDLPTIETVTRNNTLTLQMVILSAVAFIIVLAFSIALEARRT